MEKHPLVIFHYFLGFITLSVGCFAIFIPKRWKDHRLVGLPYLILYTILLLSGFLIAFIFDPYPLKAVEYFMITENCWGVALLVRAYSAARLRRFSLKARRYNLILSLFVLALSLFTIIQGYFVGYQIVMGVGLFLALASGKEALEIYYSNKSNHNSLYDHYYSMSMTTLLLIFNGKGFFGIRAMFDQQGDVSILSVLAFTSPFFILMLILALLKPYVKYKSLNFPMDSHKG